MKKLTIFPTCVRILVEMSDGRKVELTGEKAHAAFLTLQRLVRLPEIFGAGLERIMDTLRGADR